MTNIVIFKDMTTDEKLSQIEEQSKQFKGLVVDMNKPAERKKVKESIKNLADRFRDPHCSLKQLMTWIKKA